MIPVFNRADVLGDALRSVLAQSEQDFEIVVADDGSNDDPEAVIDRIGDPRIRYLRQGNRGGGAARNTGIDHARAARFIAFLDSDDVFLPRHLAAMRMLLDGTTDDRGLCADRRGPRRRPQILKPPRAIAPGEDMAAYLLCDRGFVPTITTVVPARAGAPGPLSREPARSGRYRFRDPAGARGLPLRHGGSAGRGVEGPFRSRPPVGGPQHGADGALARGDAAAHSRKAYLGGMRLGRGQGRRRAQSVAGAGATI